LSSSSEELVEPEEADGLDAAAVDELDPEEVPLLVEEVVVPESVSPVSSSVVEMAVVEGETVAIACVTVAAELVESAAA
jgi:hypothetical protein